MAFEDYTWLSYYENLYRRQKKINNELAMRLGETTAKSAELEVALNRVVGSPFWRVLAPARKVYGKIKHTDGMNTRTAGSVACNGDAVDSGNKAEASNASLYSRRLEYFEDFYAQWIRKDANEIKYANELPDSGRSRVRESIYKVVYIEELIGDNSPFNLAENAKWIIFTSKHGKLANGCLERIGEALVNRPEALMGYADEDYYYSFGGSERRIEPNFKPDWSPDTLDSFFYFGDISFLRADLADKLSWLGNQNPWINVYDLFLQVSELVGKHYDAPEVIHIAQILFHKNVSEYLAGDADEQGIGNECYRIWKYICNQLKEDLADGKLIVGASKEYDQIKLNAFARRNTPGRLIDGQFPGFRQIVYENQTEKKVSVLILSKDHPQVLEKCLHSFVEGTDYNNLEFVIVDNGSSEENKCEYERVIDKTVGVFPHKYIYEEMEFNFSKECNIAARNSSGDLLLFLNDDIEIVQKDWLKLMAGYANLPHIGAVGAKLLYANTDLIQHVGITSMVIGPSHKLVIYPDDQSYYYGKNIYAHDMLGVTGACLLVDSQKFNQAGMFNEDFAVAYNDVDLCMRITKCGYTNLQCNGALLYHYESLSRGLDEGNNEKWDRLLVEKHNLYLIHPEYFEYDPYYNPNLIGNHSNYLSCYDFGYNIHLKYESVRQIDASELAELNDDTFKISIDFAGVQTKLNLEEPDIIEVRGWSFVHDKDNSGYVCRVCLKKEESGEVFEVTSDPYPRDDLEKTFPDEINVRLGGFVSKILRSDLPKGTYVIGIEPNWLNDDLTEQMLDKKVIFTENRITI